MRIDERQINQFEIEATIMVPKGLIGETILDKYFKEYPTNAYSTHIKRETEEGDDRMIVITRRISCD